MFVFFFFSTVTEKKPFRVSITKVKQFYGQSDFVKRSQWTIDQLQQVNGIDSSKVGYVFAVRFFRVHIYFPSYFYSFFFSSRTVQSLTSALITLWTSGPPLQREISAPLFRFSTTPANVTA